MFYQNINSYFYLYNYSYYVYELKQGNDTPALCFFSMQRHVPADGMEVTLSLCQIYSASVWVRLSVRWCMNYRKCILMQVVGSLLKNLFSWCVLFSWTVCLSRSWLHGWHWTALTATSRHRNYNICRQWSSMYVTCIRVSSEYLEIGNRDNVYITCELSCRQSPMLNSLYMLGFLIIKYLNVLKHFYALFKNQEKKYDMNNWGRLSMHFKNSTL